MGSSTVRALCSGVVHFPVFAEFTTTFDKEFERYRAGSMAIFASSYVFSLQFISSLLISFQVRLKLGLGQRRSERVTSLAFKLLEEAHVDIMG